MMNKKVLSILIIFLVVNTASITSITAFKTSTSNDKDFVEFTVITHGQLDMKSQIVKLPQKDAKMIEKLFDEIKKNVDSAKTKEEIIAVFNEALIIFDTYGVLGDISLQDAQKLFSDDYQSPKLESFFRKTHLRILDDNENMDCLIVGKTSYTYYFNKVIQLIIKLSTLYQNFTEKIYKFVDSFLFKNIITLIIGAIIYRMVDFMSYLIAPPLFFSYSISFLHSNLLKVNHIKNIICFGDFRFYGGYGGGSDSYPANGWITTNGINGIKKWEGKNIWGDLPIKPFSFSVYDITYPGVYDFTGISIGNFFMGHAEWVKIKQKS